MKSKFFSVMLVLSLLTIGTIPLNADTLTFTPNEAIPVAITDNTPAGITRTFTVTGVSGNVTDVRLTLNLTHTWVGDLRVTLTSPDAEVHTMFYDIGDAASPGGTGDSSNLGGAYVMADSGATTLWTGALGGNTNFVIPAGTYRSTNINVNTATSILATYGYPGPAFGDTLFGKKRVVKLSDIAPQLANGTWTLVVSDNQTGDTGTINAGTQLAIDFAPPLASTASIGGRVSAANGNGINNAVVTVTGGTLTEPRTVRTSSFGYYQIDELEVGQTYIVTVNSKRFVFANPSAVVSLQENVADLDFQAVP